MPINKRRAAKSKYVYTDVDGLLVIKTPAECTRWPKEFRLRIVRDYVPPDTSMNLAEFQRKFVINDRQCEIHRVSRKSLCVRQPHEVIEERNLARIQGTEIVDIQRKKAFLLSHDEPAIRVLMVYSFLMQEPIGGVPMRLVYDATCP